VLISGALQHEGQSHGLARLFTRLEERLDRPGLFLELLRWSHDWRHVARKIRLATRVGIEPHVIVVGYSYGGGWGAMQLARRLEDEGLAIDELYMVDAVYRSPWWLLMWRSFMPPHWPRRRGYTRGAALRQWFFRGLWLLGKLCPPLVPTIKIPRNVGFVNEIRQRENVPMGHKLVRESPKTMILRTLPLCVRHEAMDDVRVLHEMVEDSVGRAMGRN
jgi:pimeloyl-ACP methyl ester carboxylesterase